MGSSQEGTPPHPNLRIIPLEGAVLLPSFLHLALREHSPPPTPYPGQEEIRSPTGWERGRLWTEAEKTGETPGSNAASRSLPPGGPRGQGKDGTPGERGASFLGGHWGRKGPQNPFSSGGVPPQERRGRHPGLAWNPRPSLSWDALRQGLGTGAAEGGRCPPGGRGWGFGRGRGGLRGMQPQKGPRVGPSSLAFKI